MEPLPHLGSYPGRRAARPPDRRRPGGLAARLAISRDADSQPTLSHACYCRPCRQASGPCSAPRLGRTRGPGFQPYTRRAKHDLDSAGHAPGFAPSLAATPAPEPPPVRPKPGVRPRGRRTGGPCAGLSPDRTAGQTGKSVRVAREAVGPEGQVVPQQWLAHTTAPGVRPDDRRRLDMVVCGATTNGGAFCCDATLVSPLTGAGHPQTRGDTDDGAALQVAERRKQTACLPRTHMWRATAPGRAGSRGWRAMERAGAPLPAGSRPPPRATRAASCSRCGCGRLVQAMARHHLHRSPAGRRGHGPRTRVASPAASGTGSRAQPGKGPGPRRGRWGESAADAAVGA